jgi:hypothetical protein
MKKTHLALVLFTLTVVNIFAQTDSLRLKDEFYTELNKMVAQAKFDNYLNNKRKIYAPYENDKHLRKKFHKVFINQKIWEEFVKDGNKKYVFLQAPETQWYEKELGFNYSDKTTLCEDPVMIDSTVVHYYNTKIKGFKYDRYEYVEKNWPELDIYRERYTFFYKGEEIRSYTIFWDDDKVTSITDWDFEGRK